MEQDFLQKYRNAQKHYLETAKKELRNGDKCSHWIWFIFPQLYGLGSSYPCELYGIRGLGEAKAYIHHPILKERLLEITQALLEVEKNHILDIVDRPDDLKIRSCMTLFLEADPSCELFQKVLDKYYHGKKDGRTLSMLSREKV